MRDLKAELEQLRRKLRRMEERQPSAVEEPLRAPAELPPWEAFDGEDSFERSLEGGPAGAITRAEEGQPWKIGECVQGELVKTSAGEHFEAETLYPFAHVHGHFPVSNLDELEAGLLGSLSAEDASTSPRDWVFLDTETTGLAGGAGTFAFLIGVGFLTDEGFRVRQYFLREPAEEKSVLTRLREDLAGYRTLITYNGKGFDGPLLETRYRLAREDAPFERMAHLDLLYSCRRLWKLRFENCKLTSLEAQILGHERVGDVPGFLIPSLYTAYLRSEDARPLIPVFTHNALDILSLACLTGVVGSAYRDPAGYAFRHPGECIGLGRWMLQAGEREAGLALLRRAADSAIAEDLLARTLWEIAKVTKQLGRYREAARPLVQLLDFPNDYRIRALEGLAILYEHRLKDWALAMRYARELEAERPDEASGRRIERLSKRMRGGGTQRRLE